MEIGDKLDNVIWIRNYCNLVSSVEIVKINKKSIKAKILSCSGPLWMRGKVNKGEIVTLPFPLNCSSISNFVHSRIL